MLADIVNLGCVPTIPTMSPPISEADSVPASPAPTPGGGAVTVRRPLSRRRVLQAALDYIDRHGLGELTMRRLAAELDVEATSLYKHVTNKADLEVGVAGLVWEEIAAAAPPARNWRGWLNAYGHAIRDVAHRHPSAPALWATQSIAPVPALELFDAQLAHCQPGTRDQGAKVLRAVGAYAIGYASSELSWYASPTTQPPGTEWPDSQPPETQAQRISRIARSLPAGAPDRLIDVALLVCTGDTGDTFQAGLDLMVNGLALP